MALLFPVALLLASIPLVLALVRANELFLVRVRGGRVRVARGRLPQRLLTEIGEIVGRPPVDAELRGVNEGGRPRLYAEGSLSPEQKQRLRNVLGEWTVAQIRTAPRAR